MYVCELTKRRYRGKTPRDDPRPGRRRALSSVGSSARSSASTSSCCLLNARHEVIGHGDGVRSVASTPRSFTRARCSSRPSLRFGCLDRARPQPSIRAIPNRRKKTSTITKRLVEAGELLGIQRARSRDRRQPRSRLVPLSAAALRGIHDDHKSTAHRPVDGCARCRRNA